MATTSTDRRYGVSSGLAFKAPCKAATTANITLLGEQTVDGVALVTGDRCLVKNQTTTSQNGIYVVDTSSWELDRDWDGVRDVKKGTSVRVTDGTANQGYWYVTTSDPITPGTTSVSFSRTTNLSESAVLSAESIAALRALDVALLASNDTISVLGYTTAGDGGGGDFYWDATSSAADDGGITILPTGYAGTGRWKRIYDGVPINVKWFGARVDGSTDDKTAIQAALNYAKTQTTSGGAKVFVPPGVAIISAQITVPHGVQLIGYGRSSEIKAGASFPINTALVRLGDGTSYVFNCRVENLSINCNNTSGSIAIYSTDLQEQSGAQFVLCRAYGTNGILIDGAAGFGCADYAFEHMECNTNIGGAGNVGIWVKSAQSWKSMWKDITINANGASGGAGDHGFRIGDGVAAVNSVVINGLHLENFTNGITAEAGTQNTIILQADSSTCTHLLTNNSAGRLVAVGLYANGGTNVINDTVSSITIASTFYPMYVRGQVIDAVSGITNRGVLTQTGQAKLAGGVGTTLTVDKTGAVGTGRLSAFVGDGTGGSTDSHAYIQFLNTTLHFWGGAAGTTELLSLTPAGAIRSLITTDGPVGTFTCAAAATTTINNTAVTANSLIFLFPTNAAAATLMSAATSLYISAKSAGTSFTVATANAAAAAGTETFNYLILN